MVKNFSLVIFSVWFPFSPHNLILNYLVFFSFCNKLEDNLCSWYLFCWNQICWKWNGNEGEGWEVEKDRREAGRSFLHSGRGGPGMTTLASVFLLLSVFVFVDGLVFLPQWQRRTQHENTYLYISPLCICIFDTAPHTTVFFYLVKNVTCSFLLNL